MELILFYLLLLFIKGTQGSKILPIDHLITSGIKGK